MYGRVPKSLKLLHFREMSVRKVQDGDVCGLDEDENDEEVDWGK